MRKAIALFAITFGLLAAFMCTYGLLIQLGIAQVSDHTLQNINKSTEAIIAMSIMLAASLWVAFAYYYFGIHIHRLTDESSIDEMQVHT
jgi:hypothetical protein